MIKRSYSLTMFSHFIIHHPGKDAALCPRAALHCGHAGLPKDQDSLRHFGRRHCAAEAIEASRKVPAHGGLTGR